MVSIDIWLKYDYDDTCDQWSPSGTNNINSRPELSAAGARAVMWLSTPSCKL